jgi:hypothetical protein
MFTPFHKLPYTYTYGKSVDETMTVDRLVGSRRVICLPACPRGSWLLPSPEIARFIAKIWADSRDRLPRLAFVLTPRSHAVGRQ